MSRIKTENLAAVDKIDFQTHVTSVPVQMLEAYYYE